MHWHAMRLSARSHETVTDGDDENLTNSLDDPFPDDKNTDDHAPDIEIPLGNDDAADAKTSFGIPDLAASFREINIHDTSSDDGPSDSGARDDFLQCSIPTFTRGTTPYGYQQALKNRIRSDKLEPDGEFDMRTFTPTFIHDCLMLPGSLTQLLRKLDTPETIRRMTPALLPGFHAYVHTDTLQPCIMPSLTSTDYVQGMVIFGQGKKSRNLIHQHYHENCRRVKVEVEIDIHVPVLHVDHVPPIERWRLQRRKIWAHAWLWANVGSGDIEFRSQAERWTIEAYLSGALESCTETINIQEVWPDAEIDVDDLETVQVSVPKLPEREVVYGGCGHLDHIVENRFTGW